MARPMCHPDAHDWGDPRLVESVMVVRDRLLTFPAHWVQQCRVCGSFKMIGPTAGVASLPKSARPS